MEIILEQLTGYIATNKIDSALSKMKSIFSFANSEFLNDVILLQGQFAKLKSDIRKGIIKREEEDLRNNKIMNFTLGLINELKNSPGNFAEFVKVDEEFDRAIEEKNLVLPKKIKDTLYERLSYIKEKRAKIKIIWIDDNPSNNYYESEILKALDFYIDIAKSSEEALSLLKNNQYNLILSDVGRDRNRNEGYEFHLKLIQEGIDIPLIFYTGFVDRSKGVPPYAFGIACLPNELLHLVADVTQRI